MVNPVAETDSL